MQGRLDATRDGLTIRWNRTETDEFGNAKCVAFENYGSKISCIEGIKSFVKRDFDSYEIKHDNDDEHMTIVSSCDGVVSPVARHCDRTTLTQFMSILSSHNINEKKRYLVIPGHLLHIMSSNGKENA